MKPIYVVGILLVICTQAVAIDQSTFDVECFDDSTIIFSTTDTTYHDYYLQILEEFGSCSLQQLTDDATATAPNTQSTSFTCHTYVLDEGFTVYASTSNKYLTDNDFTAICKSENSVSATANPIVTPMDQFTVTGTLVPEIELTVTSGTLSVGDSVYVDISMLTYYKYSMILTKLKLTAPGGAYITLFDTGCKSSELINDYSGSDSYIELSFDAVIPFNDEKYSGTGPVTMTLLAEIYACPLDNGLPSTSDLFCTSYFDDTEAHCAKVLAGEEAVCRRRREADEDLVVNATKEILVFTSEASRQKYVDMMRTDLGMTDETRMASVNDLCVEKTTSVAVLVILIAGMVLSLLATSFMFVKLRKSRKLQEPNKSENGYSNESFKR